MKFVKHWLPIALFCTYFYSNSIILMPFIPHEIGFVIGGIDNFNCTWQPLFEALELPPLEYCYDIIDIPGAMLESGNLRNCYKQGTVNVENFPRRKRIAIVHEIMNLTADALRNADYIIFTNNYQRDIAEKILGIHKPCLVLPCLPIPFHLTVHLINKPRKKSVYLGGHFFSSKSHHLLELLENLVHRLDANKETAGAPLACYFVVAFDDMVDAFNAFKRNVASHALLKDRVEIHGADNIPYLTMFENMAACSHTYLWRNELTLERLKELIAMRDVSILDHSIGESSMLTNAVAVGSIPIVENAYRFRAYFETDLTFSYQDFVKLLADFIISIDNE